MHHRLEMMFTCGKVILTGVIDREGDNGSQAGRARQRRTAA